MTQIWCPCKSIFNWFLFYISIIQSTIKFKVRREKGFTQKQIANNADIEISQISRTERGIINPTICTLKEIA